MLTLLDRYLLRKLMNYLFLGLVVFTLVLFFSDALLDFMKDLQHYGISGDIVISLIGLQIPNIVAMVIPMSALLATLIVYGNLNSHFELVAMRMAGLSLYRLAWPAMGMALVCTAFSFLLYDQVVPLCNQYSRALKTYAIQQQKLPATDKNFMYKQFDDQQQLKRLIYVSQFDKRQLGYSTVIDLTQPNTVQVVQASGGHWGREALELHDAHIYTVSANQKVSNTTHAGRLVLHDFIQARVNTKEHQAKERSFLSLYRWIQANQNRMTIPLKIRVDLWEKLMVPLSTLPLVLIAIPLALTSPRQLSNLGYLWALGVLLGYYILRHVGVQLGEHHVMSPAWATVLPVGVILLLALALLRRKNQLA